MASAIDTTTPVTGNPTTQSVRDNFAAAKSEIEALQTTKANNEAAWTAYTPTFTPATGAFTTASATGRYKQVGKIVYFRISATITAIGTGGGGVVATLPVTAQAAGNVFGTGREYGVTGLGLWYYNHATGAISILKYDGSVLMANNYTYIVTGFYEAA